jgi:outer membrane lipoprotein SlyB
MESVMSTQPSRPPAVKRACCSLFAAATLAAAIATGTLSACGPRDDSAVAARANAAAAPTAPAPTGQPVPPAQTSLAAVAPAPAYAPPPPNATATYPADPPQAQPMPTPAMAPAAPAVQRAPVVQPAPSGQLGSIASIEPIRQRPQGTGTGAVVGGVLGAVVGNQFGHGLGRAAMTGVGAAGGAIAGNNVERNYKTTVVAYRVNVRLENGHTRTFQRSSIGDLHVGDRVRVDANGFHRT